MHHRSGCCLSVAGSVESLSHNSNLVGRGRRYRDHSVQMCIADLNLEMQGRYASSADMTVWSVNAGQVGGHVAGVEKRGSPTWFWHLGRFLWSLETGTIGDKSS
jgi:hypothetical protein